MKPLSTKQRVLIGFLAAPSIPLVKLFNDFDWSHVVNWEYYIGSTIPVLAMGVLMAIYAWLIEGEETDPKRLFRTCLAMPSVLLTLASNPESAAIAEAREVECFKKPQIVQGIVDTFNRITSSAPDRYVVAAKSPTTDLYVLKGEERYYVQAKTATKPKGEYYDLFTCTWVKEKEDAIP